jgi:methionyl-tRNA formyltransferase
MSEGSADVKPLLFFGAGEMVLQVASWAARGGRRAAVLTNAAQAEKAGADGRSFREAATAAGVAVAVADALTLDTVRALAPPDARLLSVGAPWIFQTDFIAAAGRPILNLHGTRLPRDRGGNIFSWLILSGQRVGIAALHEIVPAVDAGPIVAWEEFVYPPGCHKPIHYIREYETRNVAFLERVLSDDATLDTQPGAQPEYLASHWPRLLAAENGWIDWSQSLDELVRFVCAFDEPYGGARTTHRGRALVLRDALAQAGEGALHPYQQGIVQRNNGRWLTVAVRGGELLVSGVTDEQGADVLSEVQPGDRLLTTSEQLDRARVRMVRRNQRLVPQRPRK